MVTFAANLLKDAQVEVIDLNDYELPLFSVDKEEDIVIIKSPVRMPGRAINNHFLKDLEIKGKLKINCPYRCLTACKVSDSRYCIAKALLNSYLGDVDHGLIFCGQNAHRIDKIITVKELFKELISELEEV